MEDDVNRHGNRNIPFSVSLVTVFMVAYPSEGACDYVVEENGANYRKSMDKGMGKVFPCVKFWLVIMYDDYRCWECGLNRSDLNIIKFSWVTLKLLVCM